MSGDQSDSTPCSVSSYMNFTSVAPASSAFWINSCKNTTKMQMLAEATP